MRRVRRSWGSRVRLPLPSRAQKAGRRRRKQRTRHTQPRCQLNHARAWRDKRLSQALFATLARLFTNGDPRHAELERGKFNKAIKNLVFAGLQPDDLPALKAAFERLWPKATCTALALANHLPQLIGTAEGMGWQFQTAAQG